MTYQTKGVSGLLSWLFGWKHKKPVIEPENLDIKRVESLLIHRIIAGPFEAEYDDEPYWWIECLMEYDGQMVEGTLCHYEFDKVYSIVRHLSSATLEPYVIGVNDEEI